MPYIKDKELRIAIQNVLHDIEILDEPGDLNFAIITMCHNYIKRKGLSYSTLNEVTGVLECAKLELYRQVVAKYEDKKRLANGSVSELDSIGLNEVS